ncbi:MAG: hypothetical protein ACOH2J_02685 [Allorhizobium sp.]
MTKPKAEVDEGRDMADEWLMREDNEPEGEGGEGTWRPQKHVAQKCAAVLRQRHAQKQEAKAE